MKTTEFFSPLLGERYVCAEHDSGLPIYVFPKKRTTTCALLAVRYGSTDCTFLPAGSASAVQSPAGVAHYLEHKLFENEDGSDSFARFAMLGADANAYTSYDRTAYTFSCTEHFDEALAELFGFVTHPHFTDATVEKERGIITEEIRMYADNPWERCFRNLLRVMYRRHPLRQDICGSEASIRKITPAILYDCYDNFYTPENMVLVVCGDVTAEQVLAVADRALPAKDFRKAAKPVYPDEPLGIEGEHRICQKMPVAKPLFAIGIKDTVKGLSADERFRRETAMSLLCDILFSRSGSFYNALFENQIISPAFSAGYSCTDSFAFTCLSGEADEPDLVFALFKEYVKKVRTEGISDEDFERCRRVQYADELRAYDSTEEIANRLLSFVLDGTEMFDCPAVLQSMTKAELETLLRENCREEYFALSVIKPTETEA